MSAEYAIQVDHVDKKFYTHHYFKVNPDDNKRRFYEKREVHAVDDVDFAVKRGEIFGLLGPNGAGKTTTVKMLSGLVRPTSGKVYVDGFHVETQRTAVLRRIGVVLEGTRTVVWPLTPLENLSYFGNLRDVRGSVLRKRANELIEFMGLRDKRDVQVRRLSRGQKQRVAICIALITDPPVVLLDEPTTGLDVQTSRAIKDKVIEMTREQGKSVIVTTHDMHVAQELCDRIGIINHGKLIACKTTEEMLALTEDQAYEISTDRPIDPKLAADVPGVLELTLMDETQGPGALVSFDPDPELRSRALYEVFGRLRVSGAQLRSVTQRQQTLEDVFLKLTSGKK